MSDGPRATCRLGDDSGARCRIYRLAPAYTVLYAYVLTLVAFDGIMALQPHWFSNLLGGWIFMGAFLGAHMLLALLMIHGAKHLGVDELVSPKQRHDLGKLCFGFSVFWTYLMWAQFLVIWYGNLPRRRDSCLRASGAMAADRRCGGRGVPHSLRRTPGSRAEEGAVTLAFLRRCVSALWLERYLLVMPSVTLSRARVRAPRARRLLLFAGFSSPATRCSAEPTPWFRPGWRKSRWIASEATLW